MKLIEGKWDERSREECRRIRPEQPLDRPWYGIWIFVKSSENPLTYTIFYFFFIEVTLVNNKFPGVQH